MIQAWFETNTGAIIPLHVPNDEVQEIAALSGRTIDDLFSIEIPAGASRHSRIRGLVSWDDLTALYSSITETGGLTNTASAVFKWRENSLASVKSMRVWLMPPKPLFVSVSDLDDPALPRSGVAIVEAVDQRYWWHRRNDYLGSSNKFTFDGRWDVYSTSDTAVELIDNAINALSGLYDSSPAIYRPSISVTPALEYRLYNFGLGPKNGSTAMRLDYLLSHIGYMLIWSETPFTPASGDPTNYGIVPIANSNATLASFMAANPRAVGGGFEAPSVSVGVTEKLSALWMGEDAWQVNRTPPLAEVWFPNNDPENLAEYENTRFGYTNGQVQPQRDVVTGRSRPNSESFLSLSELPHEPTSTDYLNPWLSSNFADEVAQLASTRAEITIGRIAWGGWPTFPAAAFRGTMLRFCLGKRNGKLVPISVTDADIGDWIFGPSGVLPTDPRDLVIAYGDACVQRLGSGMLNIGTPPANMRVFPALITSAVRLGTSGNAYWNWRYSFTEVEPNYAGFSPMSIPIGNAARAVNTADEANLWARNFAENGNVFVAAGNAGNIIAPNVRQSEYTNATIDALEIRAGTIVMMCQQFPAIRNNGANRLAPEPRYWFSMPNAVKVTCNTGGGPFTGDTDFGYFLFPTDLIAEYGTFDAEEGDNDYGGFGTPDYGSFSSPLNEIDFLYIGDAAGGPTLDLGTY